MLVAPLLPEKTGKTRKKNRKKGKTEKTNGKKHGIKKRGKNISKSGWRTWLRGGYKRHVDIKLVNSIPNTSGKQ